MLGNIFTLHSPNNYQRILIKLKCLSNLMKEIYLEEDVGILKKRISPKFKIENQKIIQIKHNKMSKKKTYYKED